MVRALTITIPVAATTAILIPPVPSKCAVNITCGFGAAQVTYSQNEDAPETAWGLLPGAGVKRIILDENQALYVRSTLAGVLIPFDVGSVEG